MNSIYFRLILVVVMLAGAMLTGTGISQATTADVSESYFDGQAALGYRSVSSDREIVRVLEYAEDHSGMTGALTINGGQGQSRFFLDGTYLSDQEYRGDLAVDSRGVFRLELSRESMVHNLEHYNYVDRPEPGPGLPAAQNTYITYEDKNPDDRYELEISESSAHARIKHPSYPAHINLSYWRQEKDGSRQLRFADEGHGNIPGVTDGATCTKCHQTSRTRDVEWVTDEFTAGVDAHVGPVDIIVEQLYREFRDKQGIPVDLFGSHNFRTGPADYQHDEAPDSKLSKTTLKLHTSLAGGLVGAGAFSIGTMENESKLTDVRPTTAETDFYQAAGDVTYIINPRLTANFRYRMTDLDSDNTATLTADGNSRTTPEAPVRDSMDVTRSSYEAALSLRPSHSYTVKVEYRFLEIDRSNTGLPEPYGAIGGVADPNPVWALPEEENIHRVKLSLQARPLGNSHLKLKGHYIYETSEDPAYGTSFEDRHEGYLGATLTPSHRWGIQASARYNTENNDGQKTELFDAADNIVNVPRSRERETTNVVGSFWLMPTDRINVSASYGYLTTEINQDLIFGAEQNSGISVFDDRVAYDQQVHTASMLIDWRVIETLRATAEGRYIRSWSSFDPNFFTQTITFNSGAIPVSSSELKEISEVDIAQSGVSLGLDWNPLPAWICSLNYSFDDYDDHNSNVFDGSAQAYMVSVGHTW